MAGTIAEKTMAFPATYVPMIEEKEHSLPERKILERVQRGEKEAYQAIVVPYMKKAYFIALGFVHNHQDALDLSQESFIKAFRNMKKFDTRKPFFPWFYEILKNLCLDHLKRRVGKSTLPLDNIQVLDRENEDREMKEVLWRGIHALREDQKEILLLRYFQQLSYKEMADLTGKPIGTVMSSLHNARKQLRQVLNGFLNREEEVQGKK